MKIKNDSDNFVIDDTNFEIQPKQQLTTVVETETEKAADILEKFRILLVEGKYPELIEKLTSIPDQNIKQDCLNSVLKHVTYDSTHFVIIEALLELGADVNMQDEEGNTLLNTAVQDIKPELVELLLKHGADVDLPNNEGQTPLYNSMHDDNIATILLTADKKPDCTVAEHEHGETPLQRLAAQSNIDTKVLDLLIQGGADINKSDNYGCTPLHTAAHEANGTTIKELLKRHARLDLNKQNEDGDTPLHIAVTAGKVDIVKVLIKAGANLNIADVEGKTPLHTAVFKYNQEEAAAVTTGILYIRDQIYIDKQQKLINNYKEIGKELLKTWQIPYTSPIMCMTKLGHEMIDLGILDFSSNYKRIADLLDRVLKNSVENLQVTDQKFVLKAIIEDYEFIISYFDHHTNTLNVNNIDQIHRALTTISTEARAKIKAAEDILSNYSLTINKINEILLKKLSEFKDGMNALERHIIYMLDDKNYIQFTDQSQKNIDEHTALSSKEKAIAKVDNTLSRKISYEPQVITLLNLDGTEVPGDGKILNKFLSKLNDDKTNPDSSEFIIFLMNNPNLVEEFSGLYNKVKYNLPEDIICKVDEFIRQFLTEQPDFKVIAMVKLNTICCELQQENDELREKLKAANDFINGLKQNTASDAPHISEMELTDITELSTAIIGESVQFEHS